MAEQLQLNMQLPKSETPIFSKREAYHVDGDAIACQVCGGLMQRAGSCYVCPDCGSTSGCS